MICPQCGFMMDAFDKECARCQGKGQGQQSQPTQPLPQQAPPQPYSSQAYPPQPYPPAAGNGSNTGLKVLVALLLGCLALPVGLVALFSIIVALTLSGAKQSKVQEQSALAQITILNPAAAITYSGSEWTKRNTIEVTGDLKNSGSTQRQVKLEARIYDQKNVMVASGMGYETVPAAETVRFKFDVDDYTQTSNFSFRVFVVKE